MRDAPDRRLLVTILLAIVLVALPAPPARSPSAPPPPASGDRIADLKGKIENCEVDNRMMSKARVYADVNVLRPKDYWDYESLTVQWGYARYRNPTQTLTLISPFLFVCDENCLELLGLYELDRIFDNCFFFL